MSRRRAQQQLCPTPSKRRYESIDDARDDCVQQMQNPRWQGTTLARFAYRCMCLSWHRTSKGENHKDAIRLV